MRVWRISNHVDLSGRGGELADGRWNVAGTPVVYCSDHPATTLLEVLVHVDRSEVPSSYRLLAIDVPDGASNLRIEPETLPPDWRVNYRFTQDYGTALLKNAEHLFVFVPCVLAPFTWNVLLNPRHPEIGRAAIALVVDEPFDPRLVR